MTETQARSAMHSAQVKIEAAMKEYKQALEALHRITGAVHSVDATTALKFNQATGSASDHITADC